MAQVPPRVKWLRGRLPDGDAGNRATVAVMLQLALQGSTMPAVYVLARSLVRNTLPGDELEEMRSIFEFVRDRIRYTRDPLGIEAVQRPDLTLLWGTGDCDDKATLLASLLRSVGIPTRFVMVAANSSRPDRFSHVYVEALAAARWWALDAIVPHATVGWEPPGSRRERIG